MSIECVGMDGKKTPLEEEEQMAKLVGGTLSPINIAMNAVRKFGSIAFNPCIVLGASRIVAFLFDRKTKAQKLAIPRPVHDALFPIHFQS